MRGKPMRRREFLKASTVAGVSATAFAGCIGGGGGGDPSELGLAFTVPVENVGSLLDVPEIREQMENIGDEYELEVSHNSSTPDSLNQMAAGDVDMALLTTVSYANAIQQEAVPGNIAAITTDFWDAHDDYYGFTVFAGPDTNISDPADLEGQTLGVNALDTGIHAIYVKQLVDAGIDPEEGVEFTELDFPTFTSALNEGRIDAGIYPALFAGGARAEEFTPVFRSQDVYESEYPFAYMAARKNSIDEKEDALNAWGQDYLDLLEYMEENRSTVVSQAAEHFDLSEEVVDGFFLTEDDYYRGEPTTDVDRLSTVMDELAELGFIEDSFDVGEYVNNDFVS